MSNYSNIYGVPNYNYMPQQPQTSYYAIVNGVDGAKNYPISFNQTMLLMDSNQPIAYKKTANGLGQTTIECYRLVEITEQEARGETPQEAQPQVDYALKSDLDKISKKLDNLCKKIAQNPEKEVKADV